jgi:hypothetical protein
VNRYAKQAGEKLAVSREMRTVYQAFLMSKVYLAYTFDCVLEMQKPGNG